MHADIFVCCPVCMYVCMPFICMYGKRERIDTYYPRAVCMEVRLPTKRKGGEREGKSEPRGGRQREEG